MTGIIEWFRKYGRVVQTFAIMFLVASTFWVMGNQQGFREGFEMGNELGRIEAEVMASCEQGSYPPFEITIQIPTEGNETSEVIQI